jgi:hypothetical protein
VGTPQQLTAVLINASSDRMKGRSSSAPRQVDLGQEEDWHGGSRRQKK